MSNCVVCLKPVQRDTPTLSCSECNGLCHAGKCSGIAKKDAKPDWLCPGCARNKLPPQASVDTAEQQPTLRDVMEAIRLIGNKLTEVSSRVDGLDKVIQLQSSKNDSVLEMIENQGKVIEGIENSMDVLSTKYEEIKTSIDVQSSQVAALQKHSDELSASLADKNKEIGELRAAILNLETYSRRNNLEIHGLEPTDGEDVQVVLKSLAEKLQVSTEGIEVAHRLPAKEGKIPPIIVRFERRAQRDSWFGKRNAVKAEKIFINEHLPPATKHLLWQAKQVAKTKSFKFTWVKNGNVLMKKSEGLKTVRIQSELDLLKLS